ncbi:hypothetical protein [Agromyces sp. NPDC058064]|uniref:hypothetical protein n=1 Tax=Agromyces sp. NPDC058064 TaxID=3346322 RepID=UPI0036DCE1B6
MNHATLIHELLIQRDIDGFVAGDWTAVETDFDAAAFMGSSGESGIIRLAFPALNNYRDSWLAQAERYRGMDGDLLSQQLHAAQRLERIDVSDGRALVTKVFDGTVDSPSGPTHLAWTTYFFLRFDGDRRRWLITGFVGFLPTGSDAR